MKKTQILKQLDDYFLEIQSPNIEEILTSAAQKRAAYAAVHAETIAIPARANPFWKFAIFAVFCFACMMIIFPLFILNPDFLPPPNYETSIFDTTKLIRNSKKITEEWWETSTSRNCRTIAEYNEKYATNAKTLPFEDEDPFFLIRTGIVDEERVDLMLMQEYINYDDEEVIEVQAYFGGATQSMIASLHFRNPVRLGPHIVRYYLSDEHEARILTQQQGYTYHLTLKSDDPTPERIKFYLKLLFD